MLYLARRHKVRSLVIQHFDVRCVRSAPPARKRLTTAMAHRVPADVRDTFMRHDRNHSGRLDYRELRNTLEALSLDCTTSHAANILRRFDRDGNGVLDLNEFYTLVRELREWQWATCPPDVRAKFAEFDKDHNGRLDYRELRNALQARDAPRAAPHASVPPCRRASA